PLPSHLFAIGLDGGLVSNTLIRGNVIGPSSDEFDGLGGIGLAAIYGGGVSGTVIQGNYIGVGSPGSKALPGPKGEVGIRFIHYGGTIVVNPSMVENVIWGWGTGIFNGGPGGATIEGNLIGTDSTGLHPVPNGTGIYAAEDVHIGGTMSGQGNIIAYNND